MEGTIGEVRLFAANFAPRNWWYCDGSIIAIRSNTALFSILGTTYGGDGQTTFALPDLRGRTAVGSGQGPGLSYYALGEMTGANTVTLTSANLAPHTHAATLSVTVPAYSDSGDANTPNNNILAAKANMYSGNAPDSFLKPSNVTATIGLAGGTTPISLIKPVLGMNYIICMTGVFPARN